MVNTLFKGRLSRMSSTGAAAAIPKTVEVKSVSHGMTTCSCNLQGIVNLYVSFLDFEKHHKGQSPCYSILLITCIHEYMLMC